MITAYAANILATCQQEIAEKSGMAGAAITPVIRMLYNPQGKSAYNFVRGGLENCKKKTYEVSHLPISP